MSCINSLPVPSTVGSVGGDPTDKMKEWKDVFGWLCPEIAASLESSPSTSFSCVFELRAAIALFFVIVIHTFVGNHFIIGLS